jgi:hypothetical protein
MFLRFMLPTNYASRDMQFVLSRDGKGWSFGAEKDGYFVAALNHQEPLLGGKVFRTRWEAVKMGEFLDFPPYAIWNGRKRAYEGQGKIFRVHARNHPENLGVS